MDVRTGMAARGVTWNRRGPRGQLTRLTIAVSAAVVTVMGIGLGPVTARAGLLGPLPDLASVEQVIHAGPLTGTGQGIDVALLDTGVTPVPGLDAPSKLLYGPDLSFDSQDPNLAYVDGYGHGTAMAGIIAGNDGLGPLGYQGVAPSSRIVSVKVGSSNGATDVSQMIAGIDWIVQHAHDPGMNIRVLNLSLGTSSTQYYANDPLAQAAENAWRHGIVVVVAAGNDNTTNNSVADPATDPYVIAVGAEDPVGTIASNDDTVPTFSQRGTGNRHPDLVAPGVSIMGLLSPGSMLATQFPNGIIGGRFFRGSGTSQAAALTSGAVADLLSLNPNLTPDQVKKALTSSTSRISVNNPNYVGAGLLNLAAAANVRPSTQAQSFPPANGSGSLEQARGDNHVTAAGVTLTGEQDIFGSPWVPSVMVPQEQNLSAWNGGVYNGVTWSGNTWTGVTWSGVTWSGVTWSGVTWSGVTWSGVTWSGVTWSGATWSSVTWSGATWSGATWSSVSWV
jgi:serine protease AprX